jgi:hypothetical protein
MCGLFSFLMVLLSNPSIEEGISREVELDTWDIGRAFIIPRLSFFYIF